MTGDDLLHLLHREPGVVAEHSEQLLHVVLESSTRLCPHPGDPVEAVRCDAPLSASSRRD